jgi:hypothetical protein
MVVVIFNLTKAGREAEIISRKCGVRGVYRAAGYPAAVYLAGPPEWH